MKFIIALALLTVSLCDAQTLQKTKDQPKILQRGSVIEVKGFRAMPISGIRYGGKDGFLFKYHGDRAIRYASFDGRVTHIYDQGLIPKYAIYDTINDYTYVDGDIYMLTYDGKDDRYLSKYSFDGTYQSTAKIEVTILPDQLGCMYMNYLGQGQLVLICQRQVMRPGKKPDHVNLPYTAVINTNGTLVRELTLPRDLTLMENPEQQAKHELDARSAEEIMTMLEGSGTDQDSLGNVMISRFIAFMGQNKLQTEHPVMFILRTDGSIRRLKLPASKKVYGGITFARLIDGKIVTTWTERDDPSERFKTFVRVFDLTGKMEADWEYNILDFGSLLLTWNSSRALFVTQTGDPAKPAMGLIEAVVR